MGGTLMKTITIIANVVKLARGARRPARGRRVKMGVWQTG
jgi:hypothetical protein